MSERRELHEAIIDDYRTVVRAMDRVILPTLVERDITMAQFKALILLSCGARDRMTVTELGAELSIGQPSASLLVDQLVKRGYATRVRDDEDRRRVFVAATTEGVALVDELRQGRRSTFVGWLERLDTADAEILACGLRALAQAAAEGSAI